MATITVDTNDLIENLTNYISSEDIGMLMEDLGIPGETKEVTVGLNVGIEMLPGADIDQTLDSIAEWARSELESLGTYVDETEISGVLRIREVFIDNVTDKKVPAKKAPAKKAPAKRRTARKRN